MAPTPLTETWTYIEEIVRSRTPQEVEATLLRVAGRYGLTSAFGGIIPQTVTSPRDVVDLVMIQQLPVEWGERYRVKRYLLRDPILRRLQSDSVTTFTWEEAYATAAREDVKTVGGEASDFGLKEGVVVPIESLDRCPIAVSFGGPSVRLAPDDLAALRFATTYAIGQILHHRAADETVERLSPRELDCLRWAAEGKSDWEIGTILGISPATVEKHHVATRAKLNAVNRGHAIAKALRLKIIR